MHCCTTRLVSEASVVGEKDRGIELLVVSAQRIRCTYIGGEAFAPSPRCIILIAVALRHNNNYGLLLVNKLYNDFSFHHFSSDVISTNILLIYLCRCEPTINGWQWLQKV